MRKELCFSILYLHSALTSSSSEPEIKQDEGSTLASSWSGGSQKQFLDTSYLDLFNAGEVEIQLEEGKVSLFSSTPGVPKMLGFFHGQNGAQAANLYKDPDNGHVFGSIVDSDENKIMQIFTNAIGEAEVVTHDADDFTDDEESLTVPESKVGFFGARNLRSRSLTSRILDIMVVWTRRAECDNSGLSINCQLTKETRDNMFGKINLAVDETNTAFALSGVNTQLRLVHAYLDGYEEKAPSNGQSTAAQALQDLTFQYDGFMDDVHAKRIKFGADMVSLIIHTSSGCGLGWVGPHKDYMFNVVNQVCATGYFSFGHELAHNIGCNHDRGTEGDCTSMAPNYGYRDPNGAFRDIMSYGCTTTGCDNVAPGSCTRVQLFSNTATNYNGAAIGNPRADCAGHMNARISLVANYMPSKTNEKLVELGQFQWEGDPPTPSPTMAGCKSSNKRCNSNTSCCSGECTWRRCKE